MAGEVWRAQLKNSQLVAVKKAGVLPEANEMEQPWGHMTWHDTMTSQDIQGAKKGILRD